MWNLHVKGIFLIYYSFSTYILFHGSHIETIYLWKLLTQLQNTNLPVAVFLPITTIVLTFLLQEVDDIYLFKSTEKIANQYTDKPLPPQPQVSPGKGTPASGGDRDSTSPSSEYEPIKPSPSDDLRNYIQKDDNDYVGLVSPDGTAMGNEYGEITRNFHLFLYSDGTLTHFTIGSISFKYYYHIDTPIE